MYKYKLKLCQNRVVKKGGYNSKEHIHKFVYI